MLKKVGAVSFLLAGIFIFSGCYTLPRMTLQYFPRGVDNFDSKGRTLNVVLFEDERPVYQKKKTGTVVAPGLGSGETFVSYEKNITPQVSEYARQAVISEIRNSNLFEVTGPGARYTLNGKLMSFQCTRYMNPMWACCAFTYIGIFALYAAPVTYTAKAVIGLELIDENTKQVVYSSTVSADEKDSPSFIYDYSRGLGGVNSYVAERMQSAMSKAAVMMVNELAEKFYAR